MDRPDFAGAVIDSSAWVRAGKRTVGMETGFKKKIMQLL
jgi:hypothetical protein